MYFWVPQTIQTHSCITMWEQFQTKKMYIWMSTVFCFVLFFFYIEKWTESSDCTSKSLKPCRGFECAVSASWLVLLNDPNVRYHRGRYWGKYIWHIIHTQKMSCKWVERYFDMNIHGVSRGQTDTGLQETKQQEVDNTNNWQREKDIGLPVQAYRDGWEQVEAKIPETLKATHIFTIKGDLNNKQ